MKFSVFPWEYPEYSGNSFRLVLFFRGYSRVHCKHRIHRVFTRFGEKNPNIQENLHLVFLRFTTGTEYIEYSLDSERKTRIIGKIIKRSSEMAKIAIPAQEIFRKFRKIVVFCALIE